MTREEAEKMKAEAKKLTLGKWYVGLLNGKTEEVMLMKDVMEIIDKHTHKAESKDKCKNCEYYRNPDYARCHECKAESEDDE